MPYGAHLKIKGEERIINIQYRCIDIGKLMKRV
jgi:hypothetical protein